MKFRPHDIRPCILTVAFAIIVLSGASYAQSFSVTVSPSPNPLPAATPAPSGEFKIYASVSNVPTTLQKIVFYRNDVPYKQFVSSTTTQYITENNLGQDSYTYRARAYDANGTWVDSSDIKINVLTPFVFKMGDSFEKPMPSGTPMTIQTHGPDRGEDHKDDIEEAIAHILRQSPTGGTLYFPCLRPWIVPEKDDPYYDTAIYNISDTIDIPSNITLMSESFEDPGQCQIRWFDPALSYGNRQCNEAPNDVRYKPMFRLLGGVSRVRFRDMSIRSTSAGPNCYPRGEPLEPWSEIADERTTAIALYGYTGDVKDVIFENVAISNFTYGIRASSCQPYEDPEEACLETGNEISDIKIRGYRPTYNHRNLYIDSNEAYNWDVQNINNPGMAEGQGSVEIINAGQPSGYTGLNGGLKFLQVNCNGDRDPAPAFCMRIEKHGGLYIKQLHHEGTDYALTVEDISARGTNPDPIVMEGSVATGRFYDGSMKLYLIGNAVFTEPEVAAPNLDEGRLVFEGKGKSATIVDCGDIHWDLTDTHFAEPSPTPTPGHVTISDLRMQFSHSERNRSSFYIPVTGQQRLDMPHRYCPASSPNISDVGGEHFNTGVIPMGVIGGALPYSNVMNYTTCPPAACDAADYLEGLLDRDGPRGAVYIDEAFNFTRAAVIPSGSVITGDGESVQTLGPPPSLVGNVSLFQIDIPMGTNELARTSAVIMRNLKLSTDEEESTGIALFGANDDDASPASDMHFSGLEISGFTRGVWGGPYNFDYNKGQPMLDGFSWKNLKFVDNKTGFTAGSANTSNWNVMNLEFESDVEDSRGWDQKSGGSSIQNVSCSGDENELMTDCVRLEITSGYVTGLKRTTNVKNALTIKASGTVGDGVYESYQTTNLILRNSDLSTGSENWEVDPTARMNIQGRAFIVSMNNVFQFFEVAETADANYSRVTYCDDVFHASPTTTPFSGVAVNHPNKWVGHPTPTRITCESNPVPFDDTVRWGGAAGDVPMAGSMYSSDRDDHIFFRPGTSQAKFYIREKDGTRSRIVDWGLPTDVPLIGRFYASTEKEQLVAFRDGTWYVNLPDLEEPINPANDVTAGWSFGMEDDKPFVGNFYPEEGDADDQRDEIGVFRQGEKDNVFYVMNPRNEVWSDLSTGEDNFGEDFQIGDFLGRGYDQLAQYVATTGEWHIFDFYLEDATIKTLSDPETEDIAVAGRYFSGTCTQLAVWRPSIETFIVEDASSTSCGGRDGALVWGLKRGSGGGDNDIPMMMKGGDGLDHPTAYSKDDDPLFPYALTKGLWWVHDPIVPNP